MSAPDIGLAQDWGVALQLAEGNQEADGGSESVEYYCMSRVSGKTTIPSAWLNNSFIARWPAVSIGVDGAVISQVPGCLGTEGSCHSGAIYRHSDFSH